jgi:hypothetical protein
VQLVVFGFYWGGWSCLPYLCSCKIEFECSKERWTPFPRTHMVQPVCSSLKMAPLLPPPPTHTHTRAGTGFAPSWRRVQPFVGAFLRQQPTTPSASASLSSLTGAGSSADINGGRSPSDSALSEPAGQVDGGVGGGGGGSKGGAALGSETTAADHLHEIGTFAQVGLRACLEPISFVEPVYANAFPAGCSLVDSL